MCPCGHEVAARSAGDAARMLDVRLIRQLIDKRCAGESAQNFSKGFLSVRSPNFHHAEPKLYLSIRLSLSAQLPCEALPAGQVRRPGRPRAPELAVPCIIAKPCSSYELEVIRTVDDCPSTHPSWHRAMSSAASPYHNHNTHGNGGPRGNETRDRPGDTSHGIGA
jgi:hypothetical protein